MNIFKELLAEVEAIDISQVEAPDQEVTDDHTVVGEATTEIKQLLGLDNNLADEFNALIREHLEICSPKPEEQEEHDRIEAEIRSLKCKYELINSMIWYCVRRQFPETTGKDIISLHKNWEVAWSDKKQSTMPDFLDMLNHLIIVGPRPRD